MRPSGRRLSAQPVCAVVTQACPRRATSAQSAPARSSSSSESRSSSSATAARPVSSRSSVEARERQRQQQAARLPGRRGLARVLTVDQQLDRVALRPGQAAARPRARAAERCRSSSASALPAFRLARGRRPQRAPRSARCAGRKPVGERRAQPLGVVGAARAQPRAARHEALGPGVLVARAPSRARRCAAAARARTAAAPRGTTARAPPPAGRGTAGARACCRRSRAAARSSRRPRRAGRGTRPGAPRARSRGTRAGRARARPRARPRARRARPRPPPASEAAPAPDHARGVLGAERAAARDEPDRLEQRRLALAVPAHEHVQPRAELELASRMFRRSRTRSSLDPDQPLPSSAARTASA